MNDLAPARRIAPESTPISPVGVTYDPEQLCRDNEAGVPIAELLRIPPLPEGKTPWDMLPAR